MTSCNQLINVFEKKKSVTHKVCLVIFCFHIIRLMDFRQTIEAIKHPYVIYVVVWAGGRLTDNLSLTTSVITLQMFKKVFLCFYFKW